MNKTMIIAAAFISGVITTQTAAIANPVAPSVAGLALVKSGTLHSEGYGYNVTPTGDTGRGVHQNFKSDPNYAPRNTYEARIDGSAGEGSGDTADTAGNDSSDTGAVGID